MKHRIWVAAVVSVILIVGVAFLSSKAPVEKDPFINLFAVLTLPDLKRETLIGQVEKYHRPLHFEWGPDIDWGEASVSLTVSFPLDDTLYGGQVLGQLEVSCTQVLSQTILAKNRPAFPFFVLREVLDTVHIVDPQQSSYLRHCKIQVGPSQPEKYLTKSSLLHHRCADVMQSQFDGDTENNSSESEDIIVVKNFKSIEHDFGTLIGAYCVERGQNMTGNTQFHAWFIPH